MNAEDMRLYSFNNAKVPPSENVLFSMTNFQHILYAKPLALFSHYHICVFVPASDFI